MSIIAGQEIAPSGFQVMETFWVATLAPNMQSTLTALTAPANNIVDSAMLVGDRFSFSTYMRTQNRSEMRTVFSYQQSGLGAAGQVDPTTSAELDPASTGGFGFFNQGDYAYGPNLFAYISGGNLHAGTYVGSIDLTLEPHVTYLYNPILHRTSNKQTHVSALVGKRICAPRGQTRGSAPTHVRGYQCCTS
jgi:hypothetical protein